VVCRDCYNERPGSPQYDQKAWNCKCRAGWTERAVLSGQHVERARTTGWKQALQDIGERHPGEARKDYRARVLDRSIILAARIVAAMQKETEEQRFQMESAIAAWQDDLAQKEAGPEFAPKLREVTLTDNELQFVHRIVDGLEEHSSAGVGVASSSAPAPTGPAPRIRVGATTLAPGAATSTIRGGRSPSTCKRTRRWCSASTR